MEKKLLVDASEFFYLSKLNKMTYCTNVHLYLPELPRVQREIQPILVFAGAEEAVVDLFSEGQR